MKSWNDTIDELAKLPHNWNTYGGEPPTEKSVRTARDIVFMMGSRVCYVGPENDGGIIVSVDDEHFELWCMQDGSVECFRWEPAADQLAELLKK